VIKDIEKEGNKENGRKKEERLEGRENERRKEGKRTERNRCESEGGRKEWPHSCSRSVYRAMLTA
jgi:hypothetical protein